MSEAEQWRDVVGYEGYYEVSDRGRVRSAYRTGVYAGRWRPCVMNFPAKEMRLSATPTGYLYVALKWPNEKSRKHLVHRLVMAAFSEQDGSQLQVNHKDGVKANNQLENLEYCTALQNVLHCINVLGKKRGESKASKIPESAISSIRADTRSLKTIAADYGVTLQAIWMVKKRRNWSHVA